jgi:hypothetical protein
VKKNGKVAVDFQNDVLFTSSNITLSDGAYFSLAVGTTNGGQNNVINASDDNPRVGQFLRASASNAVQSIGFTSGGSAVNATGPNIAVDTQFLGIGECTGTLLTAYANGTGGTSISHTNRTDAAPFYVGSRNSGTSDRHNGYVQESIHWPTDKSTYRTSIEENIGDYFTQNTPLLDTYSGAAAAYSLRLLDSSYVGSAVEVYNGSSYADIGFNVFGELDTVALAAHCGASSGYVSKWYDQSGNTNTATQATTANMPKIYDGTTGVVTENGKPAVFFEADIMNFTLPSMTEGEVFRVLRAANDPSTSSAEGGGDVLGTGWNAGANSHYPYTNGNIYDSTGRNARLSFNPTANVAQQHLLNVLSKTGEWTARINGTQEHTTFSNTVGFRTSNSFGQVGTAELKHHYQEFILWPTDQSSNRSNIEDNINTFYSIY